MELDYETAYKAVHGDKEAQTAVLLHYDSYINAIATVVRIADDGTESKYVDSERKAQIQERRRSCVGWLLC